MVSENSSPINSPLPWADLQACAGAETMANALRAAREQGARIFVLGLPLAELLAKLGVAADIVDCVDSMSVYFLRRAGALPWTRPLKKANAVVQALRHHRKERLAAEKDWTLLATAEVDARAFDGARARIHVISNGTQWTADPVAYRHRKGGQTLGFHGTMRWEPNVTSVEHVATEILPLVRSEISEASFKIIGGPVTARIAEAGIRPGVRTTGPVPDVREALADVDLYIMPMLQGSGVKNKLLEAMATGMPVLTNSRGAEALSSEGQRAVAIADGAEELATAVVRLLQDDRMRLALSQAARTHACAHFTWESKAAQVARIAAAVQGPGDNTE